MSSLDYRLQNSKTIADQVSEILEDLEETIQERKANKFSRFAEDERELLESIGGSVSALFKVSVVLRKSTTRDRYKRAPVVNQ